MENLQEIKSILRELWLEEKEVNIYFACLKFWTTVSSNIWKILEIPKSTARYWLESLVKKQMMIKTQKWNTTIFTPEHPEKLKNLLIIEKNKIENKENKLNRIMWDLVWLYNPYTKIPKVTFYEGIDWIKKVLDDSLTSREIIDWYVNMDDVVDTVSDINLKYVQNRIKLKVKKRSIYANSKKTKEYMKKMYKSDSLNEIKFIDSNEYELYIYFAIYDEKISYITYKNNNYIWVIIQNEDIYHFHKNIFKFMWNHL